MWSGSLASTAFATYITEAMRSDLIGLKAIAEPDPAGRCSSRRSQVGGRATRRVIHGQGFDGQATLSGSSGCQALEDAAERSLALL